MAKQGTRIERYRGDTYSEEFTIKDAAGNPVNLADATIRFTVKEYVHDEPSEALLAKSSEDTDEIEITDAPGGKLVVKFEAAEMQALASKGYVYDVEVTLSNGFVHTVACDVFEILADVSA